MSLFIFDPSSYITALGLTSRIGSLPVVLMLELAPGLANLFLAEFQSEVCTNHLLMNYFPNLFIKERITVNTILCRYLCLLF